jgi:hypothetical protein
MHAAGNEADCTAEWDHAKKARSPPVTVVVLAGDWLNLFVAKQIFFLSITRSVPAAPECRISCYIAGEKVSMQDRVCSQIVSHSGRVLFSLLLFSLFCAGRYSACAGELF